jgi:hypothetical protein
MREAKMNRKAERTISFDIPFDIREGRRVGWTLRFSSDGEFVKFGLHWGDKESPTHSIKMPLHDFELMAEELCQEEESSD